MEGADIQAITDGLDEIKSVLLGLNDTPQGLPAPSDGVGDGTPAPSRSIMAQADVWAVRESLRKKSIGELHGMFAKQAMNQSTGIPLSAWMAAGGASRQAAFDAAEFSPEIKKLLDSTGGAALIRQDLEPIIYEMFIRSFPAFDRFPKEPANGLVHTWQQVTDFGDAEFMPELGTVVDDQSTYVRRTTNIAIVATRRGVSLKNQFAALQSGSGFNPENLELRGGLRAIAAKMQRTIFGGHGTDSGGTASNELGLFDPNGFTGLRALLNLPAAYNVDPATNPGTTGSLRRAIANAVTEVTNAGPGEPNVVYANPLDIDVFSEQQEDKQRWVGPSSRVAPGVIVDGVMTASGLMPFAPVPGNSIGSYTYAGATENGVSSGDTVRDIYLIDEGSVSLPYLGSEGPTTLEIPMGVGGQLTHLFIFFGMWGLALKAPMYNNKVRVKLA